MSENIKVRWLVDNEQTKIAPKTFSTQILNEDGTYFKDTVEASISEIDEKIVVHSDNSEIHVTAEEKEAWYNIVDGYATEEYVENLYKKLNSNTVLGFYCIEDVTIITNGVSKVYPANSNVEITFIEDDTFEIVTTSNNSILSLTAFPAALGTFYPWLEGVALFSNILFDMNDEAMYSKWSQGNQGSYHVQSAQYTNCIFWSDNPYISDVSKRTNYTLTHTSQLPLCYSTIPDNTFKAFYLAFGVNSDPNWGNQAYRDSFAKATWATQVFSYYGARTIGIVGHDDPDFNIVLPKDCRGLMFDARNIECAGTFDAVNTTNFGAKSGSWREAFGDCPSLRRLYIKNLKVGLNISWSPIDYDSISYIIAAAANTNKITISVSPYTYNLLSQSDFDLAASKNITIELLTANYVEDRRLSAIDNKADKDHNHDDVYYTEVEVDTKLSEINTSISNIENGTTVVKNAEHASDADKATSADSATVAESAIKAIQDASGNVIESTYETKNDAAAKLTEAKEYTDTVASGKSDTSHNHDSKYDAKGSADTALASAKSYTDSKTSGLASTTTVDSKISTHNTSTSAHNDIRNLITALTTKVNNFLDVDDTTTDQLSEVITLINNNKGTLESLTTSKINVSDIVNNLTTNSTNKVLSAAQGVAIKALIDTLESELDSHTHDIDDVSGLQAALDGKAASSHGTHVSYSTTAPVMDGTASVGSASTVARSDHKHPTDTSRASKAEFDTHVADTIKHITSTERTNWGTAYTHSQTAHAPSNAEKNQNAFSNITVGSTTVSADSVTDTVTFVGSNVTITPDATNDKITFAVADGTTSAKGVVQLTNSTSSTSTTTAATPSSVKNAYDLANTAKTNAATAQSRADSAYTLAESKADSTHTHDDKYYTKAEVDALIAEAVANAIQKATTTEVETYLGI